MHTGGGQLDIFDRVWTAEEIGGGSLVARLQAAPTLFCVRQPPVELPEHGGPLSVKMVAAGQSTYRFGRRAIRISPGQLLLVGSGDPYATQVEAAAHIVTAYVPDHLLRSAARDLSASEARRMDDPLGEPPPLAFAPHVRADTCGLRSTIEQLATLEDPEMLAEQLVRLSALAARLALDAIGAVARVEARRPSVRRELFRRASVARQLIESAPGTRLPLEALADHAALSQFHLLRVFTAAFGETPFQMRRRLCMARASALLRAGNDSIGEVAAAVGFKSPAAFARAFRQAAGVSPREFRQRPGH